MHSAFLCQWRGRAYSVYIGDIHVVMLRIYRVLLSIRTHRSSCSPRLCSLPLPSLSLPLLLTDHRSPSRVRPSSLFRHLYLSSSMIQHVLYIHQEVTYILYQSYVRACNIHFTSSAYALLAIRKTRRIYHYDSPLLAHCRLPLSSFSSC